MLRMKCPQTFFQCLTRGLETHAHSSCTVYANRPPVTAAGAGAQAKTEWRILPRPGVGVRVRGQWSAFCGMVRGLWSNQVPRTSHLQGTSSVSCTRAWASVPTAHPLDSAVWPALTFLATTRLLLTLPFQGPQLPRGAAGNLSESRERRAGRTMGSAEPGWIMETPVGLPLPLQNKTFWPRPTRNPSIIGQRQDLGFCPRTIPALPPASLQGPHPLPCSLTPKPGELVDF